MLFIWDVTIRWAQSFSFMRQKAFQGGRDGTWQCELKAAEPTNGKKAHLCCVRLVRILAHLLSQGLSLLPPPLHLEFVSSGLTLVLAPLSRL